MLFTFYFGLVRAVEQMSIMDLLETLQIQAILLFFMSPSIVLIIAIGVILRAVKKRKLRKAKEKAEKEKAKAEADKAKAEENKTEVEKNKSNNNKDKQVGLSKNGGIQK